VVAAGVPVLRLVAFSMPMLASCHIVSSSLRGAGDTRHPFFFTCLGFFAVRLPLTFWLSEPLVELPWGRSLVGMDLGLYGCWLAMQADLWFRGVLFLWRFLAGNWQATRV
jgi:Na+-driven multidrug efflux pump